MFKRISAIALVLVMALSFSACGKDKTPEYSEKEFEISGFWAPYDITEEAFTQYKNAGFNTLAMINHSLGNTSEEQFYLGSERTMKALKMCKKVGLKAILNYNDWKAEQCEGEGYNGETPFSKFDLYGDYKDIITGVHICDEPYTRHIPQYGNETLVNDFKKVFPDAKFIVNLIPMTAVTDRGFASYEEMMEIYEETFMEPFDKPFVSVDVYPFHEGMNNDDLTLAQNYRYIAESAKKFGVKPGFILQASVGGGEFEMQLSESDLRWEINSALAFGADTLQYYCYSVPKSINEDGSFNCMYDYCVLNQDDTPSEIYYSLQKIHKEIQSYASVILSYDWQQSAAISGTEDATFRLSPLIYDENFEKIELKDAKHYVSSESTQDTLLSRFYSEEYGEAYMFVNFSDRNPDNNVVTAKFKDCKKVAIYGGEGFDGTPEIVELSEEGDLSFELAYGEGVFVTFIK